MWRVFVSLMMPTFVGVWFYVVVVLAIRLAGLPLILFDGPGNEGFAVLIWYMWDEGNVAAVGAIGVMLMTGLVPPHLRTTLRRTLSGQQRAGGLRCLIGRQQYNYFELDS